MSPLTKLFVVLNVILSLLIASAAVVWVNQAEDFRKQLNTARVQVEGARAEVENAKTALAAQQAITAETSRTANAQVEAVRQANNQTQQRMNEAAAKNAEQSAALALQSADLTRVTEALKAAQDSNAKKDEAITQLRTTNDDRLKQNVELNTALTEKSSQYEVTERERRYLAEQLAELKRTVDKQASIIKDAGIRDPMYARPGIASAPPINGVIRSRREIANVPYALISVGANDGVTKGMEFKVIDRNSGSFLGVLTVDSVSDTEATGRLSGPRVGDIKPGAEVKTQL